ncbi:polyribonucleotide nucleotidyltransferase [bacterium]|nr:polyribonucleotide nucleotidyltransferase [bacterium]
METKEFRLKVGNKDLIVEVKNLAERANGEILVRYGDTLVLATCVMSQEESKETGFFPLSVNYEERYYAAGKIRGPKYIKREGKPSDEAVINSRLIDRAIRPQFPKDLHREVQVIVTCLSWDSENDADVLGVNAASIALSLSDIPWKGPVASVRIGRVNGNFVVNPTYSQRDESDLDLVCSGIEENGEILINMIECGAEEVEEETILEAFSFSKKYLKEIIDFQKRIKNLLGKEKVVIEPFKDTGIEKEVRKWLQDKLEKAIFSEESNHPKTLDDLRRDFLHFFETKYTDIQELRFVLESFEKEIRNLVHRKIIEEEKRPDGRKLDQIRPMEAAVALVPRSHGSGFFSRGKTKALSILTLGAPGDQQIIEGMEIVGKKRFMHHYNFPPYCAGEIKPLRGPGRREIGHGMLVEKALSPLIPSSEEFPYTIRIVSEILSSNGSTSMASVCSSSLALMDGGVPISRPAAGIAIGLMMENQQKYKILTDIQGVEDHHGDMDFKVAGTEKGITAIQMDVKIPGIGDQILRESLMRAKKARLEILEKMKQVLSCPRLHLSPWAPRIYTLKINPEKIGELIGTGGKTIRKITEDFEVVIDIEEDGKIFVTAQKEENAKKAIALIKNITREVKVGEIFQGKVTKIFDFGTMVEFLPGREGLIHSSRLRRRLKPGETVMVRVAEIDPQGRINLSLFRQKKITPTRSKYGPKRRQRR